MSEGLTQNDPLGEAPIGTVIANTLSIEQLTEAYPEFDTYWLPADGRDAPAGSRYAQLKAGDDKTAVALPDLRGQFIRGLNLFTPDVGAVEDTQRADPDNRVAEDFQADSLQNHAHQVVGDNDGETKLPGIPGQFNGPRGKNTELSRAHAASFRNEPVLLIGTANTAPGQRTARIDAETRPKNVAMYYYIRIN